MDVKIKFDEDQKKFYAIVEGKESVLQFLEVDQNTLEYIRTYVPVELRHHGIAAQIVDHALKYAESNAKKVIPSCSYVRYYIEQHPQYEHLL